MKSKISSKTKIIVAISLAAVFMVAAIVSIVLVLAANTQNLGSNITISYTVDGVAAKTSANYAIIPNSGTSITKTAMTTSGGGQEVTFGISDDTKSEKISPAGNIELDAKHQKVVFEYVFENLSEAAFSLSLTKSPTAKNMTETYYVSSKQLDTADYTSKITLTSLAPQAVTEEGQKIYVYIMAAVSNENKSASYNGSYNWNLKAQDTINITLNTNGTTSSLKVIPTSAVTGIAMPVVSIPTNGSKVFLGYFTAASGGGTQYINADGTSAHEADLAASSILYANFSEDTVTMSGTKVTGVGAGAAATKTVIIPESAETIGDEAFLNQTSIETVKFLADDTSAYADTQKLTSIGANAFKGCSSITKLVIPEGVTSVGDGCFQNMTNLEHLVLPTSLTSVPFGGSSDPEFTKPILKGSQNLKTLECNANIFYTGGDFDHGQDDSIDWFYGYYVQDFYYYENSQWYGETSPIKNVTLNSGYIKANSFMRCSLKELHMLSGVTGVGGAAFYMSDIESVYVSSLEQWLSFDFNDNNYEGVTEGSSTPLGGADALYINGQQLTEVTIPASVTSISKYAFENWKGLTKVTFEDPTGWTCNGEAIDVSDPETNATNLKDAGSWSSTSATSWGYYGLEKSAS